MMAPIHSPRRTLALMLVVGVLWATGQPADAAVKKKKPAEPHKPEAIQSIEIGNVGEKARVDVKQVQGVDPKDHAKVLDLLAKRDADARKYEQRAAELEAELQKARASGVSRVLAQAAQPEADDLTRHARDALLKGDSVLAEQLLRQQEERAATAAEAKRREAAILAREIAALAIGRDSRASLAALERAAKYEPEDFLTLVQLGDAQAVLGLSAPAMASYHAAYAIAEALAARDPGNTEWQRGLSVIHERLGDVFMAQDDRPGAWAAYRKSLTIAEDLATRDPANTEWQRNLSVSHTKIGNVQMAQGDWPGALAAYRNSLAITDAMAARDPANIERQRDLSVIYEKIGNVLVAQGDGPGALVTYRKGLTIREALAALDPANTGWQSDLSVIHERIGNVLVAQGDGSGALAAYRNGLTIAEALAALDPANTGWQRELSVIHERIGNVLVAQGDGSGALAAYRNGLTIAEALAALDPANTKWQVELVASSAKLGALKWLDKAERRSYLRRGLDILRALKASGRLLPNQDWTGWFEKALQGLNEAEPKP